MEERSNFDVFSLLRILKRRVTTLTITVIALSILSISWVCFFYTPPIKVQMKCHSSVIDNNITTSIINDINNLISAKEYELLSEQMNLPIEKCKTIQAVQAKSIESGKENGGYTVQFYLKHKLNTNKVSSALKNYLQSTDYIAKKQQVMEVELKKMKKAINRELAELDSTQKEVKYPKQENPIFLSMTPHLEIIKIHEKKIKVEEQLLFTSPVNFYTQPFSPNNQKSIYLYPLCILASIGISVLLILFIEFLKVANRKINEY